MAIPGKLVKRVAQPPALRRNRGRISSSKFFVKDCYVLIWSELRGFAGRYSDKVSSPVLQ